jgi:hypothetical protein
MTRLILAVTTVVLFAFAIAQEQTLAGALRGDRTATKLAMGPVSAPQKRGPTVPNTEPSTCKHAAKVCAQLRGGAAQAG